VHKAFQWLVCVAIFSANLALVIVNLKYTRRKIRISHLFP